MARITEFDNTHICDNVFSQMNSFNITIVHTLAAMMRVVGRSYYVSTCMCLAMPWRPVVSIMLN